MKNSFLSYLMKAGMALAFTAVLLVGLTPATAQVPASNPPYNVDAGALITMSAAAASQTVNSATQTNLDKIGVVCTSIQTAVSGTPSWTYLIQGYDAGTATWNTLGTSSTISTSTTNIYSVWVQSGLIAADVPTNGVGKSVRLPRTWRVSAVLAAGSGGPTVTAKVGCNLFK